jgi:hypothetical protein
MQAKTVDTHSRSKQQRYRKGISMAGKYDRSTQQVSTEVQYSVDIVSHFSKTAQHANSRGLTQQVKIGD